MEPVGDGGTGRRDEGTGDQAPGDGGISDSGSTHKGLRYQFSCWGLPYLALKDIASADTAISDKDARDHLWKTRTQRWR